MLKYRDFAHCLSFISSQWWYVFLVCTKPWLPTLVPQERTRPASLPHPQQIKQIFYSFLNPYPNPIPVTATNSCRHTSTRRAGRHSSDLHYLSFLQFDPPVSSQALEQTTCLSPLSVCPISGRSQTFSYRRPHCPSPTSLCLSLQLQQVVSGSQQTTSSGLPPSLHPFPGD